MTFFVSTLWVCLRSYWNQPRISAHARVHVVCMIHVGRDIRVAGFMWAEALVQWDKHVHFKVSQALSRACAKNDCVPVPSPCLDSAKDHKAALLTILFYSPVAMRPYHDAIVLHDPCGQRHSCSGTSIFLSVCGAIYIYNLFFIVPSMSLFPSLDKLQTPCLAGSFVSSCS